jgi:hypothetical protein
MVEIINAASKAPKGAVWQLRRSLAWINNRDLEGLSRIELLDKMSKPPDKAPQRIKDAFAEGYGIYGIYHRATKSDSPYITLYIEDIYRGVPSIYWWTTVPTLLITSTLAHEVGHHVVAKRGYINKPAETRKYEEIEEAFANRYAFSVWARMKQKWYYRIGEGVMESLAEWQYGCGIHDWNVGMYAEAAEHWRTAWTLNPDHKLAAEWYWRAKEMCSSDLLLKN